MSYFARIAALGAAVSAILLGCNAYESARADPVGARRKRTARRAIGRRSASFSMSGTHPGSSAQRAPAGNMNLISISAWPS